MSTNENDSSGRYENKTFKSKRSNITLQNPAKVSTTKDLKQQL